MNSDISISLTKDAYKNVLFKYAVDSYFTTLRIILLILLSFAIGAYTPHSTENESFYTYIVFPIAVLLIGLLYFLLLRFLIPYIKFKKLLSKWTNETSFTIRSDVDYLTFISGLTERKLFWSDIISIKNWRTYIILELLENSVIIIPKQNSDEEKLARLLLLAQNGIIRVRGTLKIPLFIRPPYLLCLFCFIPVLGIVVGITLIFLGIFEYKNKILVGQGIFGILFTIAFFLIAFHGK